MAWCTTLVAWSCGGLSTSCCFWPPLIVVAALVACALASVPGGWACRLRGRGRIWMAPLSVITGLLVALCMDCGWKIWWRLEWATSGMWDGPHHLGTLIGLPVLIAMQSAWFCTFYGMSYTPRRRVALWAMVPLAAAACYIPASHLAILWWLSIG